MTTSSASKKEPVLSKRRLGFAGIAAFLGCAVCCAVPFLAAAGLGGGALATLSSVFRPGSELLVGGSVFVVALVGMALWSRFKKKAAADCGPACDANGNCCDEGVATKNA